MTTGHLDAALALWRRCEGVGLNDRDTPEHLATYLARNPGMSHVAVAGATLVGTVLAGHDGRRGYLHHLAVDASSRGRGIGAALVDAALAALARDGIGTCHCFVFAGNADGRAFWRGRGWRLRDDLVVMTRSPPQ